MARQFLISKGIKVKGKLLAKNQEADDEDSKTHKAIQKVIEDYARDNQLTIESILKEACLKWLDEGLLEQYTPLVISNNKELLNKWLKTKAEARATLQKLIDKGELKVRERTADETRQDKLYSKNLYDGELANAQRALEILELEQREKGELDEKKAFEKFSDKVITGESLYNFKGDFEFIKEFKERVERYDANAGLIYADDDKEHTGDNLDRELLIAERDKDGKVNVFSIFGRAIDTIERHFETTRYFKETTKDGEIYLEFKSEGIKEAFTSAVESIKDGYAKLLAFEEIFKKLNKIYEAETDHLLKQRLGQVSEFIDLHNSYVERALDDLGFLDHLKPLKTRENLYIEKEKIAPHKETLAEWKQRFSEVFNDF